MTPTRKAIGSMSAESFDAAMSIPASKGPVVFIGAPWLVNDPRTGEVKAIYTAPEVTHGSHANGGR